MTQWLFWWAVLLGPVYLLLLVGLLLARRFCPEYQILFEFSESAVMIAAAVLAAAATGLLIQII